MRVRSKFSKKVFNAELSIEKRVGIFSLERQEGFFWREHRDEKPWIFTAKSHAEKVKIAVSALHLSHCPVGQKVELAWAGSERLHVEFVVPLINHIVLVPTRPSYIDT